jgi:hypothetical protein
MAQRESRSGRSRRPTPAVGDEVRLAADVRNEYAYYERASGGERTREPVDGVVVAIREISSGQRVKVAAGDARRYVFDIIQNQTFDPRFSSKANAQGATPGHVQGSEAFRRVQTALRERSGKSEESADELLLNPPLSAMLDGWRIVRVCAARVDVKEAAT